jgi:catechol 2,3-dioxygenase-like lactoylglutathione lyase family enzyme
MQKTIINTTVLIAVTLLLSCSTNKESKTEQSNLNQEKTKNMKLGAFSISLNVKDLNTSKQFYEKFGFTVLGGDLEQNYLIMKNENSLIGLFQGMLPGNILTFNPGWDENGKNIESFDDVRKIQEHLKSEGVKLDSETDINTNGPASIMLTDPDGNIIYIDQHR